MTAPGTLETVPDWSDDDSEETDLPEAAPANTNPANFLTELGEFFNSRPGGPAPQNFLVAHVTRAYLDCIHVDDPPEPQVLEQHLLAAHNSVVLVENKKATTSTEKHDLAKRLTPWQIAQVLLRLHSVIRIAPNSDDTDRETDLLAMYVTSGPNAGTYTSSEDDIRVAARRYNTSMSLHDFKEVLAVLKEDTPRRHQSTYRDLIPANNGVVFYGTEDAHLTIGGKKFHFKSKQVHPFDPAILFLAKSHIDYVADAPEQTISHPVDGSVWDVVSWIDELFDAEGQEGLSDLIWEIIGAILRPYVRWDTAAWFYSEAGSNGKGTLCALMRNLVGPGTHTSIPLSDFGKDFALEPLLRANAVIVDENDVGTFIEKAANLKAIITNDVIQINRKHKIPLAYQFFGFMVQCINDFPRMKDKSDSNYRRQLVVPFAKSFTGEERKYIKDDYLQRKAVLEYVMWHAINRAGTEDPGNYYTLSRPPATSSVLADYKEVNDPVRALWEEFRDQFTWDILPFPFIYDLYKSWFAQVSPSGSPVSRQQFVSDLVAIVRKDDEWHCPDKNRKIRPGQMMAEPETLIAEYELKDWYSPNCKGDPAKYAPEQLSRPLPKANYRGLLRQQQAPTQGAPPSTEEEEDD